MAEVTVKQLAEVVGVPVERLLTQMNEAGIAGKKETSEVSESERQELLAFLKRSHGEEDEAAGAPKKITLKRKTTSQLKVADASGKKKTVNVEVRKTRTYVKRETADADALKAEAEEKARLEAEEQARQAAEAQAREDAERKAREAEEAARKAAETATAAPAAPAQAEAAAAPAAVAPAPAKKAEPAEKKAEQPVKKVEKERRYRDDDDGKETRSSWRREAHGQHAWQPWSQLQRR